MKRELFLKGFEEYRNIPVNLPSSDRRLFVKEFKRYYKDIESLKYKNSTYYKGHFYDDKFNNLTSLFKNQHGKYIKYHLNQIKNIPDNFSFYQYLTRIIRNANSIIVHILQNLFKQFYRVTITSIRKFELSNSNPKSFAVCLEKGDLLTANWNWTNYFHWNHDFLPLILFFYESNKENNNIIIPISFIEKAPYVEDTLKILNIKYKLLENNTKYFFHNLEIIDAKLSPGNQRASLLINLREKFYQSLNIIVKNKKEVIYISRRDNSKSSNTNSRNIINEEECIRIFEKFKVKVITTLGLSIRKQFNIFSNCKTLIAVHGAGLTNMIFMKSKSNILEIRQESDTGNNCYFSMASALKHNYYYLNALNEKNNEITNASLYVDVNFLENKLKEILI